MSAQIEATTEWRPLRSLEEARIVAANKDRWVKIGGRAAIVGYSDSVDEVEGPVRLVQLDFSSDPRRVRRASPECEDILRATFPDVGPGFEITDEYLRSIPPIYREVLRAFVRFDPTRIPGEGLAVQSLHSVLDDYPLGEVRSACDELERGGVLEIRQAIFAHPTPLGEVLIERLSGTRGHGLPPFVPPSRD